MEKGLQKLFRAHFLGAHIVQTAPKYIWMWHCMVPEIQSETDKIVCHLGCFLPFYAPPSSNDPKNQNFEKKKNEKMPRDITLFYIHVHHKQRSYDIWYLKYKV